MVNLLATKSICLNFPRIVNKNHTIQTELHERFLLGLNRNVSHKPLKVPTSKKCLSYTCVLLIQLALMIQLEKLLHAIT